MYKYLAMLIGVVLLMGTYACCKPVVKKVMVTKTIYLKDDIPNLKNMPKLTSDESNLTTRITNSIIGSISCYRVKRIGAKVDCVTSDQFVIVNLNNITDIGLDIINIISKFKKIKMSISEYNKFYDNRENDLD